MTIPTLPRELRSDAQYRRASVEAMTDDAAGGFTGLLVPYESPVELMDGVWEVFTRHALRAAVKDLGRVKVMAEGHGRTVIGGARALESRESGMWGDFVFDSGDEAQDVRRKMSPNPDLAAPLLDELSIEFRRVNGGEEITEQPDGSLLVRVNRARLLGVSPVCHGAYGRAAVAQSVRADKIRDSAVAALMRLTA